MRTLVYQVQPTAALFILWPSFLVTDEFLAHYFLRGKKVICFPPFFFFLQWWRNMHVRSISVLELYIQGPTFDHVMHRMLQSFCNGISLRFQSGTNIYLDSDARNLICHSG